MELFDNQGCHVYYLNPHNLRKKVRPSTGSWRAVGETPTSPPIRGEPVEPHCVSPIFLKRHLCYSGCVFQCNMKKYKNDKTCIFFLLISCLSIVLRFLIIPWDGGGFFYHLFVVNGGFIAFHAILPQHFSKQQMMLNIFLFPFLIFLLFGSLYFAVPVLAPFTMMTILFFAVAKQFRIKPFKTCCLTGILLLPLVVWGYFALSHMISVWEVRHLHPSKIDYIRFTSDLKKKTTDGTDNIVIHDPQMINKLVNALKYTYPYSPNHDGLTSPYHVLIKLTSGEVLTLTIGDGNSTHPHAIWIEVDDFEAYQNLQLRQELKTLGIVF